MNVIRHVLIRGRVQGVGYRAWTEYTALSRGIEGWVRNRRDGSVVLMDEAHNDVLRWSFRQAWINKVEGPSLKATGNEVAIESMELLHEGIVMEIA